MYLQTQNILVRNIEILLVEDDAGDIDLTKEAFSESRFAVNLNVIRNGEDALAYLRREVPYHQASTPDLILLDLNMPRKNGFEVLREIKIDQDLAHLSVIVMTTSQTEEDILISYALGANLYLSKPFGIDEFAHVVRSIEDFWLTRQSYRLLQPHEPRFHKTFAG